MPRVRTGKTRDLVSLPGARVAGVDLVHEGPRPRDGFQHTVQLEEGAALQTRLQDLEGDPSASEEMECSGRRHLQRRLDSVILRTNCRQL